MSEGISGGVNHPSIQKALDDERRWKVTEYFVEENLVFTKRPDGANDLSISVVAQPRDKFREENAASNLAESLRRFDKLQAENAELRNQQKQFLKNLDEYGEHRQKQLDALKTENAALKAELEGIPVWGSYKANEVANTVRLKLKENAEQIVSLKGERDALTAQVAALREALKFYADLYPKGRAANALQGAGEER